MPKLVSRIQLKVLGVRVERLQDISEEDARAEGCEPNRSSYCSEGPHDMLDMQTAKNVFCDLWEREVWDANPWMWVIEFERVERTS
jgi:hypothetical protein